MLGLIYKDLCLIKKGLLILGIPSFIYIIAATCIPYAAFPGLVQFGLHAMVPAFLLVGIALMPLFNCARLVALDECKKWSGFVISGPAGYKQQVLSKYFLAMAICGMPVVIHVFGKIVGMLIPGTVSGLTGITINAFYIMILYLAFQFPFEFRFGSKNGVKYKMGFFLLLFYGFMIWVLFGQVPDSNEIMDYFFKLARGEVQLPKFMQYMGVFLPFVAIGAYYISYKISCRLYLKGVELYEA